MRSLLLPWFSRAFWRGSHTTTSVTCGWIRSYSQAAEVPSSKVTCKSPRRPRRNCRIVIALVSITHSITILPAAFMTAIEMLSLWASRPIYFAPCGELLSVGVEACTQTLLLKRRHLCVGFSECLVRSRVASEKRKEWQLVCANVFGLQ